MPIESELVNNDMKTITFTENPFSYVIKVVFFGSIGFIILAFVLSIFRLPLDDSGNETTEKFLLMILGVEILIFLMLFLIRSFIERKTITCDSKSCDIYTTNFWDTFHTSESFLWSEVTDTNLSEERVDKYGSTVFIEVEVEGKIKRLLSEYLSSRQTFSELIEFVNTATPHLNYVWEKTSDFGDRQVVLEVRKFSKVVRI
jgi:hypothetical protein